LSPQFDSQLVGLKHYVETVGNFEFQLKAQLCDKERGKYM